MVELRRQLGLKEAVALGIGGTIGGGIFVLVGATAAVAGPAAILSFGLAFLCSMLFALPYAELATRYPRAGGGYAFTRGALGPAWGFLMGWGYWGAYLFISGYVTLGFGGYLQLLTGLPMADGALALIVAVTIVNLLGMRISGRTQIIVVAVAVVALLGFALSGLLRVKPANFSPFLPRGTGGALTATLLAFLAFGGFDIVAAAGEEVKDPDRNLPRAILLTLALVLGLYLLVAYVALGVLPWEQLGASGAPLSEAASRFLGPVMGAELIALAALLTTAATANAVLVVTSRIAFAMSRDGLLPAAASRVSKSTDAPWVAVLASGILMGGVALGGSVALSTAIGGFLYVVHFMYPPAALVSLRRRAPSGSAPAFRMPLAPLVLPLAFVASFLLIIASGETGILGGLAWLAAGLTLQRVARVAKGTRKNKPDKVPRNERQPRLGTE